MIKVLVTGGAGFIGSNIVRELLSLGHDVVVLDDLSSGHKGLLPKDAYFVSGSVDCDEDLKKCFDLNPEYVIHAATLFANQNSIDHSREDLMVSGMGTMKVLEYCRAAGVKKILYTSSSCVYGPKEFMDEVDEVYHPGTPYAITKLLGERYCKFWALYHGINTVIVRLFNTYGPGESPGKYRNIIPNFFKLALKKRPLPIAGDGNETRDFVYVSDTVSGVIGALFGITKPGEIFNLASGRETRIIDLARMINDITGNPAGVEFISRRQWDSVLKRCGSIKKARRCFNYEPRVDLPAGLALTHEWVKKNV